MSPVVQQSDLPIDNLCSGSQLRALLAAAVQLLSQRSAGINNLNVFPVPDGDTGTNLLLTMRAALLAGETSDLTGVGDVTAAVARGALMGARGNSGVIFSQFLRGFARHLADQVTMDGTLLADALNEAAMTARAAVRQPVEGTILTVASDVAAAAQKSAQSGARLVEVLDSAVDSARESVARTRKLLPILAQANVVDAGGMGLLTILEGMRVAARGEPLPPPSAEDTAAPAAVRIEVETYGYCTEFLIHGTDLDPVVMRDELATLGDSLLVVGDPTLVRVHLHTFTPGRAIDLSLAHGRVEQVKIEDMQVQNDRLRACGVEPTAHGEPAHCALIAVVAGEGFRDLFRSLGAAIVPGGQTLNPSAEEILNIARSVPAGQYVLLPNNANVVLTAAQARDLWDRPLAIVPTGNLAQGVAAALAFQPQRTADENASAMAESIADVRTGQITVAVRDATIEGLAISRGALLGIVDDRVTVVRSEPAQATIDVLGQLGAAESEIVTLYSGEGVSASAADELRSLVQLSYPKPQVELVRGGQPHYLYILACE